ncbi:rRNA adenine dimethyltransferase family protein [Nitrosopumilus sp.]|uniref:ribosomal RNA small subunit methyltransferase A n=1 Tax=Nitrosopumilus sp. TaxID=2024843 RepID=UPI00262E44BB|nr:rRNA adenine dimethyltransferase family protein [Nitrosopumilus sp.]
MIKRRRLGQHFLNSEIIGKKIVSEAKITKNDIVFEVGTGKGILTPLLCKKAFKVISVDADEQLIKYAKSKFSQIDNLVLKSGDGFKKKDSFTIFVSNLPYSRSKDAVEWLAQTSFSHGVVMVQKEFAQKLVTKNLKDRKAISIIAEYCFKIDTVLKVSKNNFSPPPKIDSVVLKIKQKANMDKKTIQTINKIFSYRRKTVKNILKQFGIDSENDKRVDDLLGAEIVELARQIQK